MFTGIIEDIGIVKSIRKDGDNKIIEIQSSFSSQLKPDQSVSHNGVCLTITKNNKHCHFVTAVKETLQRSNLKDLSAADEVNLERSLLLGDRLDGHFVQGHIDTFSQILKIKDNKGSLELCIALRKKDAHYIVEKGSVCLNGISLTVSTFNKNSFNVIIIPYTLRHTNLRNIKKGDLINVEFDIFGKYIHRILKE